MPRRKTSVVPHAGAKRVQSGLPSMPVEVKRLGEALEELSRDPEVELRAQEDMDISVPTSREVPIRAIDMRGANVRTSFSPTDLHELVQSIKRYGVLEPVLVQEIAHKTRGYRYRLIAGFRRTTAARLAGLTTIPARIMDSLLTETDIKHIQLTENIQRENMRVRDIVATIQSLRDEGASQREIAEQLGISQAKVSVYLRLGDLIRRNRTIAQYVDQGLIGPSHFSAAMELITKVRKRAGELTDDPAKIEEITQRAENLFTQMLERLAEQKRLTARAVAAEVARLLTLAGVQSPAPTARSAVVRSLPAHAVLANVQRLDLNQLDPNDLKHFVDVVEPQLKAAKARLKTLGGQEGRRRRPAVSPDSGEP